MARRRWGSAIALVLLLTACAGPPRLPEKRPSPDNLGDQMAYGLELLRNGDRDAALAAMERANALGATRLPPSDSSQFLRDLAELRLAHGDDAGAADAAQLGLQRVAQVPLTAQFRDQDMQVFRRLLFSLLAAARRDTNQLAFSARSDASPPLADPWYLLGWAYEQQGNQDAARDAYRSYLARAPQFGLLRLTRFMQQHAKDVVARA